MLTLKNLRSIATEYQVEIRSPKNKKQSFIDAIQVHDWADCERRMLTALGFTFEIEPHPFDSPAPEPAQTVGDPVVEELLKDAFGEDYVPPETPQEPKKRRKRTKDQQILERLIKIEQVEEGKRSRKLKVEVLSPLEVGYVDKAELDLDSPFGSETDAIERLAWAAAHEAKINEGIPQDWPRPDYESDHIELIEAYFKNIWDEEGTYIDLKKLNYSYTTYLRAGVLLYSDALLVQWLYRSVYFGFQSFDPDVKVKNEPYLGDQAPTLRSAVNPYEFRDVIWEDYKFDRPWNPVCTGKESFAYEVKATAVIDKEAEIYANPAADPQECCAEDYSPF